MTTMSRYYISRAFMAAALGCLFALAGGQWWAGAIAGVIAFAFFLWAPHSQRYTVRREAGVTPLRRDERSRSIRDRAARNAFVVTIVTVAGIAIYYGTVSPADVPVSLLSASLAAGMLTYLFSDLWLRRT